MVDQPDRQPTGAHHGVSPPNAAIKSTLPELLAPAGSWACARAAVENGADAVYFALGRFNARIRAENFSAADLPALAEYLHRRGVRGYACLNTLVFENELAEAEADLRAIIAAGMDAVLIQDIGIARLVRRISPDFPMHASTQMTITSTAGVEFARQLGCSLVVLARELSLEDIQAIQKTVARPGLEVSLETFVHGALCVAYSGQCFASKALGGRSANRGECAQACRMPYELICDGKKVELRGQRYLLSPQDLAALDLLRHLVRTGVASLKIEGRLKSPEYVASITRLYRTALDSMFLSDKNGASDFEKDTTTDIDGLKYAMEMSFSRGFCSGWLLGANHKAVVHGRFGKNRGMYIGKVARVTGSSVIVKTQQVVRPGDGIVFATDRPGQQEQGGRVYGVRALRPPHEDRAHPGAATRSPGKCPVSVSHELELTFGKNTIQVSGIHPDDEVWKTSDPDLDRQLRKSYEAQTPRFKRPIWVDIRGSPGKPIEAVARDELGNVACAKSLLPLSVAQKVPLTTERLREHLGRLGSTQFRLANLNNELPDGLMLPVSELNRLRREAVAELERLRARPRRWTLAQTTSTHHSTKASARSNTQGEIAPELIVLVRNLGQLEAALRADVRTLYCDFASLADYAQAVSICRNARTPTALSAGSGTVPLGSHTERQTSLGTAVFVAPPRITKPGEEWMLDLVRRSGADGYLVRNYDHLRFFRNERCVGDHSLNVANSLATGYLKTQFGLERMTVSYDLDIVQLEALLKATPPAWLEITIHQHVPMFHMEHCVFCAFLSKGRNRADCRRPCKCRVSLRDRKGVEHPVIADFACRNTVYNGSVQSGAGHLPRLLQLGARHFRIEFLDEPPETVTRTAKKYLGILAVSMARKSWTSSSLFDNFPNAR